VKVYRFIEAERASQRNVSRACALLEVSRAAYYAFANSGPSPRARRDAELTAIIRELFEETRRTYGPLRMTVELRSRGQRVGRRRIARLMAAEGLAARPRRRRKTTTVPDP